ncbi:Egg cell-secreted protein 1.4 [Citrus sinensis]|uniref:egg cell-secreted protein 1.4-like n=2 Tax=Citrus TaxID=2706 RepID=UPI0007637A25|nr:egg cell-secreted protein 1.4-like [Citrus sinensis]KAH9669385.1 Egg cell-secreted protein 1.4 [Citrus sinensis]
MAMTLKHVFFILALTCLIMTNIANATSRNDNLNNNIKPGNNLAARLEDSRSLTECWNALMELKLCSNEIIIFFLNGQADIGPDCCRTIDIITRNCWPTMLTSLGFTAEERNLLRGYCDASSAPSPGGPEVTYEPQVSKVLV